MIGKFTSLLKLFQFLTDSPVCKKDQQTTFGAMLHYPVQIPCEVEADPDDVAFRWEFNSSSGNVELVPTYTSGTKSLVNYIPRSESDFGTLQCWGRNSVGQQRIPCLFYVIPAGTDGWVCLEKKRKM